MEEGVERAGIVSGNEGEREKSMRLDYVPITFNYQSPKASE